MFTLTPGCVLNPVRYSGILNWVFSFDVEVTVTCVNIGAVVCCRSRKQRLTAVGIHCADHVTPLYPQKLALTSPTGGGRSVGIVRSRTKATELLLLLFADEVCWGAYELFTVDYHLILTGFKALQQNLMFVWPCIILVQRCK